VPTRPNERIQGTEKKKKNLQVEDGKLRSSKLAMHSRVGSTQRKKERE